MKKNLRIASAAAAALLAVAPVAASAVNTANADVSFTDKGETNNGNNNNSVSKTLVNIGINLGDIANQNEGDIAANIVKNNGVSAAVSGVSGVNIDKDSLKATNITIAANGGTTVDPTKPLSAGKEYTITISGLKIDGLINNTKYAPQSGSFTGDGATDGVATGSKLGDTGVTYTDTFFVPNNNDKGTPYWVEKSSSKHVTSAKLGLSDITAAPGSTTTPASVLSALKGKYDAKIDGSDSVPSITTTPDQLKAQLEAAGATFGTDDAIKFPINTFTLSLTARATNGKTITLPVTVKVNDSTVHTDTDYPVFVINNAPTGTLTKYNNGDTIKLDDTKSVTGLHTDVNGSVSESAIKAAFTAEVNQGNNDKISFNVDASKVNTNVAGTYPVTLTATNPSGNTSKVTFSYLVGDPDAKYMTVKNNGNAAKVVNINGNTVTDTNDTIPSGSQVATYGHATDDKGNLYYRLNSTDSTKYVAASVFEGTATEKSTSTTIMYKSAVYKNNDGKLAKAGKTIKGYSDADLVVDANGNLKKYTIEGQSFYKIAGENGYVRERNVTGSKMTLKKNAYVYKSNGRRVSRKLSKKGSTITVYGDKYKAIRHYRKEAVRIGHNKYVKLPNVKYSADLLVK